MQVQTPVIQVDCPNHGLFVVAYEHFGMDKAGRIFINLFVVIKYIYKKPPKRIIPTKV